MDKRLTEYLADPHDGSPLELHIFEGAEHQIREGVLRNNASGRWYPIRDAIPSLFVDALREDDPAWIERFRSNLEFTACILPSQETTSGDITRIASERKARDEQAEDYDRMIAIKMLDIFERPTYRRVLSQRRGEAPSSPASNTPGLPGEAGVSPLLLEAGCGTGRFTGLFSELSEELIAADMSRDSIKRNIARWKDKTANTVHYLHTDLTHLPLRSTCFDAVAHVGVYEHIPSRELREQFLEHARRVLKSDGVLLLSAYRYGGLTRFFEKEGEHAGGIPFFRFTEEELRSEVGKYFQIAQFKKNLGVYMSMVFAKPRS